MENLKKIIQLLRVITFSDYYDGGTLTGFAPVRSEDPVDEFRLQLRPMLRALMGKDSDVAGIADAFIATIPEIARLLHTDVEAAVSNDPAVDCREEVVLCYPLIEAMLHYRMAHQLHLMGVKMLPRLLTERAHSLTGIDIHPAATIGEYFCIDHGTGVVIGATSIIGNHVVIYQGVTLGAKNFQYDEKGQPRDVPRHPIIEDNVTIYSNSSVLGRVTIGHDTIIGGNVWLTHDVPPNSRIVQR